jgi:hypothetical protein
VVFFGAQVSAVLFEGGVAGGGEGGQGGKGG